MSCRSASRTRSRAWSTSSPLACPTQKALRRRVMLQSSILRRCRTPPRHPQCSSRNHSNQRIPSCCRSLLPNPRDSTIKRRGSSRSQPGCRAWRLSRQVSQANSCSLSPPDSRRIPSPQATMGLALRCLRCRRRPSVLLSLLTRHLRRNRQGLRHSRQDNLVNGALSMRPQEDCRVLRRLRTN